MRPFYVITLALAVFTGCRDSGDLSAPLWYRGDLTQDIVMAGVATDPLSLYPTGQYSLSSVALNGDQLTMNIILRGTDPRHFKLIAYDYWIETDPVQVDAMLSYEPSSDSGATCSRSLRFNLRPMRDAYTHGRAIRGRIDLNIVVPWIPLARVGYEF
jgi:hypothetical protein